MEFTKVDIIKSDGSKAKASTKIQRVGNNYSFIATMQETAKIKEAVIFDGVMPFGLFSKSYGDGYQMLSQTGGTVLFPRSLTPYTDTRHYKFETKKGFHTKYNYIIVKTKNEYTLVGATSCNRFSLKIANRVKRYIVSQDLENKIFENGETIVLEDVAIINGSEKSQVLNSFASLLEKNHPMKRYKEFPAGWCSWYCCGPDVTEKIIFDNLKIIKEKIPELKYVQIDDGFQPFMGDWLLVGDKFGRPMKDICLDIKKAGFEPAIWLAPFIASPKSQLFNEHPDWFICNDNGKPLCSADVTFGGWRDGPWYFLDLTHPEAKAYIKNVFSVIYNEWGVKYFKLDAIVWGAMPFGKRYDDSKTSVEAYRIGLQDMWDAIGCDDAYILACNNPMWPSLGLVSGMRTTGDLERRKITVLTLKGEGLRRNWMNNRLWMNDPDCVAMASCDAEIIGGAGNVVKHKRVNEKLFKYQNIYIAATGGVVLSGDYLDRLTPENNALLKRMIETKKIAADFNDKYNLGKVVTKNYTDWFMFNDLSPLKSFTINVGSNQRVINMYTGKEIPKKDVLKFILKPFEAEWIRVENL